MAAAAAAAAFGLLAYGRIFAMPIACGPDWLIMLESIELIGAISDDLISVADVSPDIASPPRGPLAGASKTSLLPGEKMELNLVFDPIGRKGIDQRNIYIFSNDPVNPVQLFVLKSRID
jgi:hypothetical protein